MKSRITRKAQKESTTKSTTSLNKRNQYDFISDIDLKINLKKYFFVNSIHKIV